MSYMHQLYGEEGIEFLAKENMCRISTQAFHKFSSTFDYLFNWDNKSFKPQQDRQEIAIDILDEIHKASREDVPKRLLRNNDIVKDFVQYSISNNALQPVRIEDLTENLFTSRSTLSVAIREATGLSPMKFIRYVRLGQVRSALLDSSLQLSINDISQRFGFTHRGHFSRYYKDLFGEQPRETLARRRGCKPGATSDCTAKASIPSHVELPCP